jgi:AbrB family looped-hinge helix DNA binding protein
MEVRAMRVSEKGQVTIPGEIRRSAGLLPGTEVEFVQEGGEVRLRRKERGRRPTRREGEVSSALERLRGSATIRMSTDEIMALTRGG